MEGSNLILLQVVEDLGGVIDGVQDKGYVDDQREAVDSNQCADGVNCLGTFAGNLAEPELDHVDHGVQEEHAADDGGQCGESEEGPSQSLFSTGF